MQGAIDQDVHSRIPESNESNDHGPGAALLGPTGSRRTIVMDKKGLQLDSPDVKR